MSNNARLLRLCSLPGSRVVDDALPEFSPETWKPNLFPAGYCFRLGGLGFFVRYSVEVRGSSRGIYMLWKMPWKDATALCREKGQQFGLHACLIWRPLMPWEARNRQRRQVRCCVLKGQVDHYTIICLGSNRKWFKSHVYRQHYPGISTSWRENPRFFSGFGFPWVSI